MLFSQLTQRLQAIIFIALYRRYFGCFGRNSRIVRALKIGGASNIKIGANVVIQYKTWLAAQPINEGEQCCLEIGDGTNIGHFNHIYATRSIRIGKNVLTADRVYISDNLHSYENINLPILKQPIKQISTVEVGDGSWIGEGACIIGAKIGRGCVIGSNAVVTKDIPDYSVAVGIPAKVIKKYNFNTNVWESVIPV